MTDPQLLAAARRLVAQRRPDTAGVLGLASVLASQVNCDELDALAALTMVHDSVGQPGEWFGEIRLQLQPGDRDSVSTANAFLSATSVVQDDHQSVQARLTDEFGAYELVGATVELRVAGKHHVETTDHRGLAFFDALELSPVDLRVSDKDLRAATEGLLDQLGAFLRAEAGSTDVAETIVELDVPNTLVLRSSQHEPEDESAEFDVALDIPITLREHLGPASTGKLVLRDSALTLHLLNVRADFNGVVCAAITAQSGQISVLRLSVDPSAPPTERSARCEWFDATAPSGITIGLTSSSSESQAVEGLDLDLELALLLETELAGSRAENALVGGAARVLVDGDAATALGQSCEIRLVRSGSQIEITIVGLRDALRGRVAVALDHSSERVPLTVDADDPRIDFAHLDWPNPDLPSAVLLFVTRAPLS